MVDMYDWRLDDAQEELLELRHRSKLFDLTDRNIVITGGAGHLGTALCDGLADRGANVFCLHRGICDVSDETELRNTVPEPIHGWVNCAGSAERGVQADLAATIDGILKVQYVGCKVAMDYMEEGGSIVNIASMWGLRSPEPKTYLDLGNEPSLAAIAAAGGILAYTRYLAILAAPHKIRVNALVPGWFPKKRGPDREDYMHEITSRVPMGRIGKPEELVGPLVYLLSAASSYMTGQQLVVDGGFTVV